MDGRCVNKGGGRGGGRSASPAMQTKCRPQLVKTQGCAVWVAWFVGCLRVSWVDGWVDGWMVCK